MNKLLKRTLSLVFAASVITGLAACAPKEEDSNAPQVISGGTAATVASKEDNQNASAPSAAPASGDTYSLTYKGVVITPGMESDAAIAALGAGYVKSPDIQSCAFNGVETSYDYNDFVLFVDNRDGKNKINTIDVRAASVDCGGVKIGSTLEEVRKAFGDPTSEELYGLCYEKNHTQIQFISTDEKTVSSILFKAV